MKPSAKFIYLHGFASGPGSRKARFFLERMSSLGVDLAVPDLAEGNFEALTITGQLRVVERLAAGAPTALIGSSMGGYVAALYAARHPEVDRLVLMAPAFGFASRWGLALGEARLRNWKETGYLPVFHYAYQEERRLGYQLMDDARRYEEFPDINQPTLIFHGRHDAVVPPELSGQFARLRSGIRVELVDSDHELLGVLESIWEGARPFLLDSPARPCST